MLDSIMLLGIGFLAAGLLTLALTPLVHERAVRLTARRYRDAVPTSVAEMQAEKDQLRATFAMSIRRLEIALEEARAKAVGYLCETAKKTGEIQRLKTELGKVPADDRCEIIKSAKDNYRPTIELGQLAVPMRSLLRVPEPTRHPVPSYRKPTAKWVGCASATGIIVSLLLLGLSADNQNRLGRKLALMIGGDRLFSEQAGAANAPAWDGRGGVVDAKKPATIGRAEAAKTQSERATERTTTTPVVIIRGGHREGNAGRLILALPKNLSAP